MIFDSLKNIDSYKGLSIYPALQYFATQDFSAATAGRHELDGEDFYMLNEYQSEAKTLSEAHRDYIDIQILLEGEEYIGVAPLTDDMVAVEANEEKDYWLYDCEVARIAMKPGYFMVLYPQDVHMPGDAMGQPVACRKIVGKIKVR